MIRNDNSSVEAIRRTLTFIFVIIGLWIFYVTVMTKLEVMAEDTKAKVMKQSADQDWDDFLYQKTVDSVVEERESAPEN